MKPDSSLIHSVWECKYHIVWLTKRRRKILFEKLRGYLGEIFHKLAAEKENRIVEGHLCIDHVHMCIEIPPPKYAIVQGVGYIKGKSAIHIARDVENRARNFAGQSFWVRGYFVSTIGRDEEKIRQYIREQEHQEKILEQLRLPK